MSEVVRLELRRQFQKELESKNIELKKFIKELTRLKVEQQVIIVRIDEHLKKFDVFYNNLITNNNFNIIDYKNDFLPDIVDRAINRKKPFTEEKSELKDAIIWKTYSDFVERFNTADCILLTNNVTDFCDRKDKSKIHSDLATDTNKFTVVRSSYDFIKTYASKLESPDNKFMAYISNIEINDEFVFKVITENFEREIEEAMHKRIGYMHPSDIIDTDYIFDGRLDCHDSEILKCESIEYDVLSETALISGILYACCDVEILEYNAARDYGEEQYTSLDNVSVTFKIYFNFDMKKDEIFSDFEITGIKISNPD